MVSDGDGMSKQIETNSMLHFTVIFKDEVVRMDTGGSALFWNKDGCAIIRTIRSGLHNTNQPAEVFSFVV